MQCNTVKNKRVLLSFPWADKGMLLPDCSAVHLGHESVLAMTLLFWQQEKQVKKVYLALTTAPVSTGTITHYMRPVNRAPRLVSEGNYWTQNLLHLQALCMHGWEYILF